MIKKDLKLNKSPSCLRTLRIILGDQLSEDLSALKNIQPEDQILMMEVWDETDYVPHHAKKIAFIFSGMRHFALKLAEKGHQVFYKNLLADKAQKVDQSLFLSNNFNPHELKPRSFTEAVENFLNEKNNSFFEKIVITEPGEYRVLKLIQTWEGLFKIPIEILEDTRFICSIKDFKTWAGARKSLRMEFFYREMRKKTGLLMDTDEKSPLGGAWNFDHDNRKTPKNNQNFPSELKFTPDRVTMVVLELVQTCFPSAFGELKSFELPVTREQALLVLKDFIENRLPYFGDFQDAMVLGENQLFHSTLSGYLNIGFLSPLEICHASAEAYQQSLAPLNAVEGFVRQIIGWREYVRGIYWLKMPEYKTLNFFNAKQPLPDFYWTGNTSMRCLSHVIQMTKQDAQSHHIQRLMITGNFALLIGVSPQEVCDWYLAVYLDAYEWVELPNTLGMALFADGGFLGSKPYASSGAYIDKMSNFCKSCIYQVKKKTGPEACPFNYLYWDFFIRHKPLLEKNPRLGIVYQQISRMNLEQKQMIQNDSANFRQNLLETQNFYGELKNKTKN